MRLTGLIIILMLACAPWAQAASSPSSIEQQRQWFEQARKALNKNNMASYNKLKAKLGSYPLTPYLDIWQARKDLKKGSDTAIASLLEQHADVPESINLRIAWIKDLAKRGQWVKVSELLEKSPSDIRRVPEISMIALWHIGAKETALLQFSQRWMNGKKVSDFSYRLHQNWKKQGHPTVAERWTRIETFIHKGKWGKAKKLAKGLPKTEQQWLAYWRQVQKQPEEHLSAWPGAMTATPSRLILADGLNRLARKDPLKAWHALESLKGKANKEIEAEFYSAQQRRIALRAAKRHMQEAADWLQKLPAREQNEETRSWQVRLHILDQQWQKASRVIDAMPANEQQQSHWLYWKARALENTGKTQESGALYMQLATQRGYYSFLSAERLGLPFNIESSDFQASKTEQAAIKEKPAIIRAYEWLQLGNSNKASREWHFALSSSPKSRWEAAAVLARSWDWHDQVIRAAFKADRLDALEGRFPLAHEKSVLRESKRTGLSTSAIWSIIRQESAFNQRATSYVGARGLMQLMPKTARATAKKLKMKSRRPDLFSPATNIKLGSAYLAQQKKRFGNLALAAAAYNAGPHRVSKWLERSSFDAAEAWVEAIPFNETRRYVQQVMAFVSVYEWRQAKTPSSLLARLNERIQQVSLNEYP
ncbi:soluble lytic murein transglycosylase [Mariprofundus micogutta]|uniref:Soluble lytic murein transglycosylase n=1 Tax=Mariprofundus micogutta TaxID=1921010 RepID=A0A1L8CL33_9PROT|nr:transglycosylase SLT domain-containing protein [Mariprofundus micogutta]GAV19624.1 soluble lytic murein transglycosylase [Mariprofundus micogutta]